MLRNCQGPVNLGFIKEEGGTGEEKSEEGRGERMVEDSGSQSWMPMRIV